MAWGDAAETPPVGCTWRATASLSGTRIEKAGVFLFARTTLRVEKMEEPPETGGIGPPAAGERDGDIARGEDDVWGEAAAAGAEEAGEGGLSDFVSVATRRSLGHDPMGEAPGMGEIIRSSCCCCFTTSPLVGMVRASEVLMI